MPSETRLEYNRKIVKLLQEYVEKEPNFRFVQLLWFLNVVSDEDKFYVESKQTYEDILEVIDEKHYEKDQAMD